MIQPPAEERFCHNCGAPNPADFNFCLRCGARINFLRPLPVLGRAPGAYPVTFDVEYRQKLSRLSTLFRLVLAVPQLLVIYALGTVVGIINAFTGMAATGSGGIGAVSAGIAEALITTAVGLAVAIPAVWMFNYFQGQVEFFGIEMANSSSELVDFFLKRQSSQAK